MRTSHYDSAFALAVTLVLMALIVTVIVAYLANTRTDRSTSAIYVNRIRAKIVAGDGLVAATKLLSNNTRYGNYITAMPIPSPAPARLYCEVYRPTDSVDTTTAVANDYLTLTNAAGEILASRAATPSGTPQVDPRPTPPMIPAGGPFSISDPGFTVSNSYDFNQIVRLGTNTSGRLINPSPTPAFGQWVRVRNTTNELTGRYAYFIEDESMKANVNVTGNGLAGGLNLRINDLTLPLPTPAPTTQLQELDPAAILPTSANRAAADSALIGITTSGNRLASRSSLALLDQWTSSFSDYAHLVTVASRDDDTTAKGWQRMDLNALVASATDNASKMAVANRIANWIRDAWTGPPLPGLSNYQMFNDSRLRLQIAANIVDYIDADNTPTDMGDVVPDGYIIPVPVLGIEKIPYLAAVEVIYEASGSTCPSQPVAGTYSATLKMKVQLRFLNLFETALDLSDNVGRVEIKGVPIVSKNGTSVFDKSVTNYVINLTNLTPVNGTGTLVPAGIDGISDSGARTFQTDWLENQSVTFTVTASDAKPRLLAGLITVKVFGIDNERLDETAIVTNIITTGYNWSGTSSTGDFLNEATTGPLQIASINLPYAVATGTTTAINFGDPRVRGHLISDRWYNIARSDASTPATTNRIAAYIDKAEILNRTYAFDWYDYTGNRPLAFLRNGPMRSVGELGNVAAPEYPWRTLYLQYPERPANTLQPGPATEIPERRSASVDYALIDLFRTQTAQLRAGAVNINTQQRWGTQQHPLAPLFLTELIGNQPSLTQTMVDRLCDTTGSAAISPIFDRRIAAGPPSDNSPIRPFFQIGELASVLSRLVNKSTNTTTGSPARSTVTYSFLRNSPTTASEPNLNFRTDNLAEQEFREVSNSITTRGNVFRILYVGQAVKDLNKDGNVDPSEIQAEYLGEAFVERQSVFQPEGINPDTVKTVDSIYKITANRVIIE
jgi:hypothetical protein